VFRAVRFRVLLFGESPSVGIGSPLRDATKLLGARVLVAVGVPAAVVATVAIIAAAGVPRALVVALGWWFPVLLSPFSLPADDPVSGWPRRIVSCGVCGVMTLVAFPLLPWSAYAPTIAATTGASPWRAWRLSASLAAGGGVEATKILFALVCSVALVTAATQRLLGGSAAADATAAAFTCSLGVAVLFALTRRLLALYDDQSTASASTQ
jgi:hypothetical protein